MEGGDLSTAAPPERLRNESGAMRSAYCVLRRCGAADESWVAEKRYLLQVAMTAEPFMTDHLFLSPAITVKQLGLPPFHVVQ